MDDLSFDNYPNFTDKGEANCVDYDPDLFFPEPDSTNFNYILSEAKKVCVGCPYQLECLRFAVENNEPGVWGGTYDLERRRMRRSGKIELPMPSKPKRWSGK